MGTRNKDTSNNWNQEVMNKLISSKFIKKYSIIYTIFREESRNHQRAKSDDVVGKGNTGYPRHCCLRTNNNSPKGGKSWVPRNYNYIYNLDSSRHWLQPLPSPLLGKDLVLSTGSLRKP